ncbi:DNA-binding pseudobarrel domain-containing protein [Tanacetum coccineum]
MAPRTYPSFFKIIVDQSRPYLPLPHDFYVRYLRDQMTKDPIVRYAKGGFEWRLKIEKVGDRYSFTDGWLNLVKDADLQYGDLVVFWLVNDSAFKVAFYTMNECEKVLPPRNKDVKLEDEVEDEDSDSNDGPYVDHDDPFFVVIITKTHDVLRLPKKFVGLPGIDREGTITMKNQDGKEWKLGVRRDKSYWTERYALSPGWRKFKRCNNLTEGDECVFKFITSERKLCLSKVTKKNQDTEAVKKTQEPQKCQHGGRVNVESEDESVEVESEEESVEVVIAGLKDVERPHSIGGRHPSGVEGEDESVRGVL